MTNDFCDAAETIVLSIDDADDELTLEGVRAALDDGNQVTVEVADLKVIFKRNQFEEYVYDVYAKGFGSVLEPDQDWDILTASLNEQLIRFGYLEGLQGFLVNAESVFIIPMAMIPPTDNRLARWISQVIDDYFGYRSPDPLKHHC